MRSVSRWTLAVAAVVVVVGCGDDDGSTPRPDAGPDRGAPDVGSDATPEAVVDPGMDAGLDAAADVSTDAANEAAAPDTQTADADPLASVLTPDEVATARTLSPLPGVPRDTTNRYADDAKAAALGQRLFFEKRFSGPLAVGDDGTNGAVGAVGESGKLACASCHLGPGLDDRRSLPGNVSLGVDFLARNALPLVNSSFYAWINWAGRFSAQWELPPAVLENAKNMNGNRLQVAHVVFDKYRADYEAVFGPLDPAIGTDTARFPAAGKPKAPGGMDGPWETMSGFDQDQVTRIIVNVGKAMQAHNRLLVSRNAAFDRFVSGDVAALGVAEVRGFKLFADKGCVSCHSGPHFSDGAFHNIGVPQSGPKVPATDNGRFADIPPLVASGLSGTGRFSDDPAEGRRRQTGLTSTPSDGTKGQFRTPSLRGVAATAPYMHAGQHATLEAVVDFYNVGGAAPAVGTKDPRMVPLGLSASEKADLVAFLKTLGGDAVPAALLQDTSAP